MGTLPVFYISDEINFKTRMLNPLSPAVLFMPNYAQSRKLLPPCNVATERGSRRAGASFSLNGTRLKDLDKLLNKFEMLSF